MICKDWLYCVVICKDWLYCVMICKDWLYCVVICKDWLYCVVICKDWLYCVVAPYCAPMMLLSSLDQYLQKKVNLFVTVGAEA